MRLSDERTGLRPLSLALALALAFVAPAHAQLAGPPTRIQTSPIPNGLTEFATANPQCTEMTNGCEICVRATAIECSTPGIACQPAAWQCRKGADRTDDSAKSAAPSK